MIGLLTKNIITNFSNVFEPLTIQQIDQEWAWSQLVGRMISIGKRHKYCSPLRSDNKPGIWFEYHNSILLIIDFGDKPNSHINCVTAWSRIKGIHWRKALREIHDKQGVRVVKKIEDKVREKEKVITIKECWTDEHENYCRLRGISPETREGRMYGVSSYTILSERTRTYILDELAFGYKYADGKYKIYFPTNPDYRFISNLKNNQVWISFVDSILLISKSHKDFLELLNVWEHSLTHVQSEPAWRDLLQDWSTFSEVLVFYDNDICGLTESYKIAKELNCKLIFIPSIDALTLVSKMDKDFINYLPKNLSSITNQFLCTDCPDSIEILNLTLLDFAGLKDYDDMVLSSLNEVEIFNWLITV